MGVTLNRTRSSAERKAERNAGRGPFVAAHRRMVERLVERELADAQVATALLAIPRHPLIPEALRDRAYDDSALPIGEGQTISAPSIVAAMTTALGLKPSDRVLEIGTGSAYQTAVLATLCEEVVSVERVPRLASRARRALDQLGVTNAVVHLGDGSEGRAAAAPYDAILVTAGGKEIPPPLVDQLAAGGRLVGPFGTRDQQELLRICKAKDGSLRHESLGGCRFVALVGEYGWDAS